MEYIICENSELNELVKVVNKKIAEGYVPLGGVSCSLSESFDFRYTRYCQAMMLVTADLSGDTMVGRRNAAYGGVALLSGFNATNEFREWADLQRMPHGKRFLAMDMSGDVMAFAKRTNASGGCSFWKQGGDSMHLGRIAPPASVNWQDCLYEKVESK